MAVAARNMLRMERMNEGKNLNLEQLDLNHFRRQESVHSVEERYFYERDEDFDLSSESDEENQDKKKQSEKDLSKYTKRLGKFKNQTELKKYHGMLREIKRVKAKIKKNDILAAILACFSFGISVMENEYFYKIYEHKPRNHSDTICNCSRGLISITTLILLILIVNHCRLNHIIECIESPTKSGGFAKSWHLRQIFIEFVICSIHCPPFLDWEFSIKQLGDHLVISLNAIVSILMMLKVYLLLRLFSWVTKWMNDKSITLCHQNQCSGGTLFSLKALFKQRPYLVLVLCFLLSVSMFGYAIRTFERPLYTDEPLEGDTDWQDYAYVWNGMWLAVLIMSTVGYGEIFPRTHSGRFITVFSSFFGLFLVSLMLITMTLSSEFSRPEKQAYDILYRLQIKKKIRILSIELIQIFYKSRLHKKRNRLTRKMSNRYSKKMLKSSEIKVLNADDKMTEKIKQIRALKLLFYQKALEVEELLYQLTERVDYHFKTIHTHLKNIYKMEQNMRQIITSQESLKTHSKEVLDNFNFLDDFSNHIGGVDVMIYNNLHSPAIISPRKSQISKRDSIQRFLSPRTKKRLPRFSEASNNSFQSIQLQGFAQLQQANTLGNIITQLKAICSFSNSPSKKRGSNRSRNPLISKFDDSTKESFDVTEFQSQRPSISKVQRAVTREKDFSPILGPNQLSQVVSQISQASQFSQLSQVGRERDAASGNQWQQINQSRNRSPGKLSPDKSTELPNMITNAKRDSTLLTCIQEEGINQEENKTERKKFTWRVHEKEKESEREREQEREKDNDRLRDKEKQKDLERERALETAIEKERARKEKREKEEENKKERDVTTVKALQERLQELTKKKRKSEFFAPPKRVNFMRSNTRDVPTITPLRKESVKSFHQLIQEKLENVRKISIIDEYETETNPESTELNYSSKPPPAPQLQQQEKDITQLLLKQNATPPPPPQGPPQGGGSKSKTSLLKAAGERTMQMMNIPSARKQSDSPDLSTQKPFSPGLKNRIQHTILGKALQRVLHKKTSSELPPRAIPNKNSSFIDSAVSASPSALSPNRRKSERRITKVNDMKFGNLRSDRTENTQRIDWAQNKNNKFSFRKYDIHNYGG